MFSPRREAPRQLQLPARLASFLAARGRGFIKVGTRSCGGAVSARQGARGRGADRPLVTVCRGCCCGTERKHPDADHAGQLDALLAGIRAAGRVRVSDCLDACEYSNVVVVGPSADARRVGARPVWIAGVLDRRAIADIVAWVRGGGPGLAHPSDVLD